MQPILFTIGPLSFYSFSIFLVISWIAFSFLFWRALRQYAVEEDKIYDMTFYATVFAFVAARFVFVIFHWNLFADTWLKIIAIWVQPGLSLYGGLIGAIVSLMVMCRAQKMRLGVMLDSFVQAFPVAAAVASIGTWLDGTTVGVMTQVPWAMRTVGYIGLRHPVGLYHAIAFVLLSVWSMELAKKSAKRKSPYGIAGLSFFLIIAPILFGIEFFMERQVYLVSLSISQWLLVAIFAESSGLLYVRGGGRELIRPFLNRWSQRISTFFNKRHDNT